MKHQDRKNDIDDFINKLLIDKRQLSSIKRNYQMPSNLDISKPLAPWFLHTSSHKNTYQQATAFHH